MWAPQAVRDGPGNFLLASEWIIVTQPLPGNIMNFIRLFSHAVSPAILLFVPSAGEGQMTRLGKFPIGKPLLTAAGSHLAADCPSS